MKFFHIVTGLVFCSLIVAPGLLIQVAVGEELTAFEVAKEGNRFINKQSKDQVVQIRSEKSAGSLTPQVWHVIYYDADAPLKAIEVKFVDGKKVGVKRPVRVLEPVFNAPEPLSGDKLKIDSDEAIKIAAREPLLARLTVKATQLTLQRRCAADDTPVWKVRLWAAKSKKPDASVEVGEVIISARDGVVLKSALKPARVN
jgi:hypothetical protein